MNAFGSTFSDSSVVRASSPAGCPVGLVPASARAVFCRMDTLPGEPSSLADVILNPTERKHWGFMRAVEKRRREWLMGRWAAKEAVRRLLEQYADLQLSPADIEIVPDPFGCPQIRSAAIPVTIDPAISIAHSHGTAVALAVLGPGQLVGIDLEHLNQGRENFQSVAFSPDERSLLAALASERRDEWALRMWCAKEAVGKALGRGLSAGLLSFHISNMITAAGIVELELRDHALEQFPHLRDKSLTVYTARESDFVFSAIIYQQGALRMRPNRQEILDYLLHKMGELTQDWDYPDPVRPESLLFTELGFESLDAVVLCTAIQEHYQTPMPFAELLAEIGQHQRDLSIDELTSFVDTHLGGTGRAASTTRRVQ